MNYNYSISLIVLLTLSCKNQGKMATISGEDLSKYKARSAPTRVTTTPVTESSVKTSTLPDPIRSRYATYLKTDPALLTNVSLYRFIDRWMYTPYKWGGADERGIDCSAFLQKLFADVYRIQIPRTSVEQFYTERVDKFKSSKYLVEGDLVFFHTIADRPISHVGLYLHNGIFINSSSSKGVSLASLDDPYWRKRYVGAGRIKP